MTIFFFFTFSLAEATVSRSYKISFGFVSIKAHGKVISGALDY